MERAPPQEEALLAHTPSLLDMQISMASKELKAIPLKEGLSCMQSSSGSCCDCLRSLALLFWAPAVPAWLLCFLPELLLSWFPFKGWFRERNSALLRTLFLSLALDRGWDAGIADSNTTCFANIGGGEKSFSLQKASPHSHPHELGIWEATKVPLCCSCPQHSLLLLNIE